MSHDEPMFGDTPIANDPEALNGSMRERGYEPWKKEDMPADAKERSLLPQPTPEREPLGRVGKIIVTVVTLSVITPFIILLWRWVLGGL